MTPTDLSQINDSDKNKETETSKKIQLDHICENEEIFCFTCNSQVIGKDIANHLFLGRIECKYCTVKIATCDFFKKVFYSKTQVCKENQSGKHEFSKWETSCLSYLNYFSRKELVIQRFCQNKKGPLPDYAVLLKVREYLCKLSAIENYDPWRNGIKACWDYLEERELGKQAHIKNSDSDDSFSESEEVSASANLQDKNILKASVQGETVNKHINGSKNTSSITSQKEAEVPLGEPKNRNENEENAKNQCKCQREKNVMNQCNCQIQQVNQSFPKSVSTSHRSATEIPLTCKIPKQTVQMAKNVDREALSQEELNIEEEDEPDDELLSAFTIGGLDQTIEYVTIQDDCREKENVGLTEKPVGLTENPVGLTEKPVGLTEKPSSVNQDGCEIFSGKRKNRNQSFCDAKKRKCHKSHAPTIHDFLPPGEIQNDNYLIIHFPTENCPEECPNCYCEFSPSMLTVNCSTFVSTIICDDCKLTIYVLPE
ncbi:uncharacterized protein LOC135204197 [Macrobrachium nipponense]|uniref:uncharacterized protein LOC135204197 n=1 Tax=Macrobrachium nipponense TaxID=159736 RepID=UPI0030C86647